MTTAEALAIGLRKHQKSCRFPGLEKAAVIYSRNAIDGLEWTVVVPHEMVDRTKCSISFFDKEVRK